MRKMAILFFMITMLCPSFRVLADSGGYIVKFKNEYIPEKIKNSLSDSGLGNNVYLTDNIDILKSYDSFVEYIETNDTVNLIDSETDGIRCFSTDETISDAWQLDMVNAQYAWNLATYGNGINVGIIDSGCNQHIDITNNLAGGHNYILNTDDYSDNVGHGTHVAGIIAAEDNGFGITGIAPKANIYALKCFDANYQTTVSMLAKAIYSAVDEYHCSVINMSLGLKANRQTLYDAIKYAFEKGVIIVAAVGNDGNDTLYYPAAYEEVIGVGSVGNSKAKSYFSQENRSVFVVAPGECYYSLKGTDEYIDDQGTSQSAPLVTGAAAILLSAKPSISNIEFKGLLENCSADLGEAGYDIEYGYGMLNTEALLNSVLGQYYVSPITKGEIIVYNNTDNDLFATGIWAENTEKGEFCGEINEIFVPPQRKISLKYKSEKVRFFLWDSLKTKVMNNEYDNEKFFEEYAKMSRSKEGLKAAGEWHQLKPLFPSLEGKSVLDLGCGYGWHCKFAEEQGATKILGIDLSKKMIEEAQKRNSGNQIEYRISGLEEYDYPENEWDCVISNLALHYIEDIVEIFQKVYRTLKPGGIFLFNIEHPVFTAGVGQDWIYTDDGKPQYWAIDNYFITGERNTHFLGCDVVKQHHTLTQIIMGLLNNGFELKVVEEAEPPKEMMDIPGMEDELRRPMMLLVKAIAKK